MEAAAQDGSAALPHVNQNSPDRPWTVDGLRTALRLIDAGPPEAWPGHRYLAFCGLRYEEARDLAYGLDAPRVVFTPQGVAERAALYECLHSSPVDDPGLDCREAVPTDPDLWCPTCAAREALGQ